MGAQCVCIYGETCTGKSTLGKYISSIMSCRYISFGDLKRDKIARNTRIGLEMKNLLDLQCPLPAKLGYAVIRSAIGDGLNIISGYPISVDEFNILSDHSRIIGILILSVSEQTLIQRFSLRRECPECNMPGVIGDLCPTHKIVMIQRGDASQEELINRRKLYRQRIMPFLESKCVLSLPQLLLDSSTLSKDDIACHAERWVRRLLTENGGMT